MGRKGAVGRFLGAALVAWTLATTAGAADAASIGAVERVAGTVTIQDSQGQTRPAIQGQEVDEGDTVITGADGEVLFKMVDSGAVALRPKTNMRFTQYRFEQKDSDGTLLQLVKGSVRALTGLIGKAHPGQSFIKTPSATIGIRGTDHETLVREEDTDEGHAGTYDRVYDGSTYIEAENGQKVDVGPDQVGFTPVDVLHAATQLGLLPRVPTFFVTGRFDDLFAVIAQELQRRLEEKLMEKAKGRLPIVVPNLPGLGNLFH